MAKIVQGFVPFVSANRAALLEDSKIRRCPLVIDASNILRQFKTKVPWEHGGDYNIYVDHVCEFFDSIQKAEITAYLFFDGPQHMDEVKMKRTRDRFQQQLGNVIKLNNGLDPKDLDKYHEYIVSNTDQVVFRDLAQSYDIRIFQPVTKTDYLQEMAAYAKFLGAPLLSANNNFYFYELGEGGYIPLQEGDIQLTPKQDEIGYYLGLPVYRRERLRALIGGWMNERLFEMAFAILRNQETIFKSFVTSKRVLENRDYCGLSGGFGGVISKRMRRIIYTFQFLKDRSMFGAESEIVDSLFVGKRDAAREEFNLCYKLCNPGRRDVLGEAEMADYLDMKAGRQSLPLWFCEDFTNGKLIHHYFDVMTCHWINLKPMVECLSQRSAHLASVELRRYIYGILLSGSLTTDTDRYFFVVKELQRLHSSPHEFEVEPRWTLPSSKDDSGFVAAGDSHDEEVPSLENMELMKSFKGEDTFLTMLDQPSEIAHSVPRSRLFSILVLRYWWSQSEVSPAHVISLLLSVAAVEALSKRPSALLAMGVTLQPAFIANAKNRMFKTDEASVAVERMHRFAELQSILFDSKMLHRLLRQPLYNDKNTENLDQYINSTFLHQMTARLEQVPPEDVGELHSIVNPIIDTGEGLLWEIFEEITSKSKYVH